MFKKLPAAALVLSLVLSLASCGTRPSGAGDGKLKIAVTFDAIYELTLAVVGDRADIYEIVPSGTDVHDFEPSTDDLAGISGARLVIYNGLGLEPWLPDAVQASGNRDAVTVDTSSGVEPLAAGGGASDPHIWLGLQNAGIQARNIFDAVAAADPENYDVYYQNYTAFAAAAGALYDEYAKRFAALGRRDLVTGHAAFGYLCRAFGLEQLSLTGVFSDGEPSARRLAELIDYCTANGVGTVFDESGESSSAMRELARETGAELRTLYTMERAEDGKTYLERMRDDLDTIYNSI